MKISVLGLGYVGSVSAACLAEAGHDVIGVDINPAKVEEIAKGRSPVVEKGLGEVISRNKNSGRLQVTHNQYQAIRSSDLSLVCVGTPNLSNGSPDLRYIDGVCKDIGQVLGQIGAYHNVVIRSTVLPKTTREHIAPLLESISGKKAGRDFGLAFNPEFLREGAALEDFFNPSRTIIGALGPSDGDRVTELYKELHTPIFQTDLETAEMIKYTDNAWHALKITFANEIGKVCKQLGIDSHELMDLFCQDNRLNLSKAYLKPGFAFGGSCLPKDLRALEFLMRRLDLGAPVLTSILRSNELQVRSAIDLVERLGKRKIGVLGGSFKADTDDLRESPAVTLIEALIGRGYDLKVYDRNVRLATLTGANREFINQKIPHIARLMVETIEEIVGHGDVLVIGNESREFTGLLQRTRKEQFIVDLVRIESDRIIDGRYFGLAW